MATEGPFQFVAIQYGSSVRLVRRKVVMPEVLGSIPGRFTFFRVGPGPCHDGDTGRSDLGLGANLWFTAFLLLTSTDEITEGCGKYGHETVNHQR